MIYLLSLVGRRLTELFRQTDCTAAVAAAQAAGSPELVNMESLAVVLLLAIANNRLVEYLALPLFKKFNWDKQLILYVSFITGLLLGLTITTTLFRPDLFIHPLVERVLIACLIGGGSNLIHDIVDRATGQKPDVPTETMEPKSGG